MMNSRFRILLFGILFLSVSLFSSCEDEEAVPTPTLTGFWELRNFDVQNGGPQIDGLYNQLFLGLLGLELRFSENNSFSQFIHLTTGLSGELEGNYIVNDDNTELTLQFVQADNETYELELMLDEMYLTRDETLNLSDPNNPDADPTIVNATITYYYTKVLD